MKFFLTSMSIVLLIVGCKPPANKSDVKTLDNFADGNRGTVNQCKGNPEFANDPGLKVALTVVEKRITWTTEKSKTELTKAILEGFSAIPPDFQASFLELGGQIMVSSSSNTLCTANERYAATMNEKDFNIAELKALAEGLDQVGSCYLFMPPSIYKEKYGKEGQFLAIVLPDDVTEIRHSFVRSFGYLVSQMYSRLLFVEGSESVSWMSTENADFRATKDSVAEAFLKDVSGTKNAAKFNQYLATGNASAKDKRSFADFVYAEAFDSYFCNAYAAGALNTRETMKTKFKNTYEAYLGIRKAQGFKLGETETSNQASEFSLSAGSADTILNQIQNAITVGNTRSFADSETPIFESMTLYNWVASAVDSETDSQKEEFGFNLGFGTAISETWRGAGILYGEYYDRTAKATDRAISSAYSANGGRSPSALATVAAIGRGVSDGSGYTGVYNDVQKRTDRIYTQVQDGRGTPNKPLGYLDTASVVANATVDKIKTIPGPVGAFSSIAKNSVSAGTGGTFDSSGNYVSLNAGQRWTAGGSAALGFANQTGATKALTNSVMSSGGAVKRFGSVNSNELSGFGQAAFKNTGQTMQRVNILDKQLGSALKSNEVYKTASTVAGFTGTYKPPVSMTGIVSKTAGMGNSSIGTAINRPAPAAPVSRPATSTGPSIGPR